MASPEAEVKPPVAEATETPAPVEAAASELSTETKAQMTPEAQGRFAALPERQKGMFARARELFSRKKDPTEQVRGAQEYFEEQRGVVRGSESKLAENQKERDSVLAEIEATGKRAVAVSTMPESVEALLDDPTLESLGRQKIEAALKDAKARADQEFKLLKKQQAQAAERATKLEDQIAVTRGKIEKFKNNQEQARDRIDDAAIVAINSNSEQGAEFEENIAEINQSLEANRERGTQLDTAISSLEAKIKGTKEPLIIEALKPLLSQAKTERAKLKEQERRLTTEKDRQGKQLDRIVQKNEKMVPFLSLKKVEALLDGPEHEWVMPMLSADQLVNLPEDRQREILSGNEANQKALLPKLKDAQLKKLSEAGIVPDKDTLLAQGILKPPAEVRPIEEARAARAAKAEGTATPEAAEAEHKTLTIGEWKANIKDALAKAGGNARGIDLPDDIDMFDIPSEDIIDIGSDQAVAAAKAEAGGDKKKEASLLKQVLKAFAKMMKELFGFTMEEAEGLIESGLTGRPRTKFDRTVDAWNKANPGSKIAMQDVPRELHGQDLSEASAKLKLAELIKKQEGGDPAKVSEFFEHRKQEVAHAAEAAAA